MYDTVESLGEMYLCLLMTFLYLTIDITPRESIVSINVSVASYISWLNLVHISASTKSLERTCLAFFFYS